MINIWDMRTGRVIAGPFSGHTNQIHSVAFSPNGKRIASGSRDWTIRVWDVEICKKIGIKLQGCTINTASLTPNSIEDRSDPDHHEDVAAVHTLEGNTSFVSNLSLSRVRISHCILEKYRWAERPPSWCQDGQRLDTRRER
jgi:WD40 repeat protein